MVAIRKVGLKCILMFLNRHGSGAFKNDTIFAVNGVTAMFVVVILTHAIYC
jgi:hypothetical protein